MAFSKIPGAGVSADTLEAGDIAANAVGASELADNAVDTAAIADLSVTNAKLPSNIIPVKPHIQYGVLQPALAGKLLDGTTSHSGNYGTAQSDGHSYYYTDIKGSKPIKDPRIGAHFGSQRHKAKSVQLLEQETATHSENVYSVDGREWFRVVSSDIKGWNFDLGTFIGSNTHTFTTFFEIVGYFNDFNCISRTQNDKADDINVTINGGTTRNSANTDKLAGRSVQNSPLRDRFVDAGSVINHGDSDVTSDLGTTPRINTIKIEAINTGSEYWQFFGVELIAQDTTSTANKSKIQIPSQNVVSYGKKFTVSGTPHYDPFNGFVNDTTLFSSVVDTATSLGLGTATTWGTPWDKGNDDHIRPFNGGRVVKWVDSSGTIKTSVTMMPANAQNIGTDVSNEIGTASATNTHTINFSDDAIENSLSEVAKSFHWREFGNGSANGGTGAGSYADFSMLGNPEDDVAYVMDDGLTSMAGNDTSSHTNFIDWYVGGADDLHITFIGTGISFEATPDAVHAGITNGVYAQNLPYGTHILKLQRSSPYDVWVDGIQLSSAATSSGDHIGSKFITFHQPKKPPVPEDAVVLADYMLMADFVNLPDDHADSRNKISKGVRRIQASRDIFYDGASAWTYNQGNAQVDYGHRVYSNGSSNSKIIKLPAFADAFVMLHGLHDGHTNNAGPFKVNGTAVTASSSGTNHSGSQTLWSWTDHGNGFNGSTDGTYTVDSDEGDASADTQGNVGAKGFILGNNVVSDEGTYTQVSFHGFDVHTPIHSSSHYQTFETPFLHELVGGDRNMEQTNLIVTPDGKSWDEITRDTSYLGNMVVNITTNTTHADGATVIFDEIRGSISHRGLGTKDWTMAYDRLICLKGGQFQVEIVCNEDDTGYTTIKLNGANQIHSYQGSSASPKTKNFSYSFIANRGDYLQVVGHFGHDTNLFNNFQIKRL